MINYIKADLVKDIKDAPNLYKAHACNAQGVWGRGIAAEFKKAYPNSFDEYKIYCFMWPATAEALVTSERIACLITSNGYSPPDAPEKILDNTTYAMIRFFQQLPQNAHVYSNRFNSGLFRVDWEKTERIIHQFLQIRRDVTWTVCDKD